MVESLKQDALLFGQALENQVLIHGQQKMTLAEAVVLAHAKRALVGHLDFAKKGALGERQMRGVFEGYPAKVSAVFEVCEFVHIFVVLEFLEEGERLFSRKPEFLEHIERHSAHFFSGELDEGLVAVVVQSLKQFLCVHGCVYDEGCF